MLIGHLTFGGLQGFGDWTDKFIHAFHMPMFFIISGFLYHKKKNYKLFIKRKIMTLLLPYVVFGGVYSVIWYLSNKDFSPVFRLLWVNDYDLPYEGALWFLTAMFFSTILFDAINRMFKNETCIFIMCILCALVGHITCILNIQLPWSLDAALIGVGLMYVGKIIQDRESLINLKWYYTVAIAIIVGVLINVNGTVDMNAGKYSNVLLFWINAVGATIVGLNCSRCFCEKFPNNVTSGFISWIGNNSIVFLCCNHMPILVVSKILIKLHCENTVLGLILSIALISFIGWVILNTPLKIIVGRNIKINKKHKSSDVKLNVD